MLRSPAKRGFTLVEVMIVVLIIGLLMGIAIPSYLNAKRNGQMTTCQENLRLIEAAKEHWAIDHRRTTGDPVTIADLMGPYLKRGPVCPSGGAYTAEPVGTPPTCALGGGHRLP